MLEKNAKTAACSCLQAMPHSQTGSFRPGNLGCGHVPVEMRLLGRMSRAERALLFGFSPAHWATNGQSVPQRELFRIHSNIIQHRPPDKWSILLLSILTDPKRECRRGHLSAAGSSG